MPANANQPPEMTTQSYWEKYGDSIIGRMMAEGATSNSDVEISRCLSGCVAGALLMETARAAREDGLFRWDESPSAQWGAYRLQPDGWWGLDHSRHNAERIRADQKS